MGLDGRKVAILLAPGFEDSELVEPVKALNGRGIRTDVIGLTEEDRKRIRGKRGTEVPADKTIDVSHGEDYDALLIPGGNSPAHLRRDERVLDLVREFNRNGKPVAAICHGPQVLAAAGILEGRTVTSFFTVSREVKKAGAEYKNRPVVVDGNIITSRKPADIPQFVQAIIDSLKQRERKTA